MFKKKYYSVYDDLKTGFFYKLTLFLGIILLVVYIFLRLVFLISKENDEGLLGFLYNLSQSGIADSIIAFSIVFLGLGIILYFFHCQFAKLAKIADELEKEEIEKNKKEGN